MRLGILRRPLLIMIKIEYNISRNLLQKNNINNGLDTALFADLPIGGFSVEAMTDSPEVNLEFLHLLCTGVFWDLIKSVCLNQSNAKVGLLYYTCPVPDNRITRHKIGKSFFRDDLKAFLPNDSYGSSPEVVIALEKKLVCTTIIPAYDYETFKGITNYARGSFCPQIIISPLDFEDDSQIKSLYFAMHPLNAKMKRNESMSSFVRYVCGIQESCVMNVFGTDPGDCCVSFSLLAPTSTSLWGRIESYYESIQSVW